MNSIFFAGAFGGIMPQLTRIAALCTTGGGVEALPPLFTMELFCGGMIIYALIGGGLARILNETTIKSAFVVGIAAPAFIANLITNVQDSRNPQNIVIPAIKKSETPSGFLTSFFLVSPARADERTDALQQTINKILDGNVVVTTNGSTKVSITGMSEAATKLITHVCFMSKDDLVKFNAALKAKGTPELNCLDQEFIQPKQNAFSGLIAPIGSMAVMVNGQLFALDKPDVSIGIDASVKPTLAGNILWALGGRNPDTVTQTYVQELSK